MLSAETSTLVILLCALTAVAMAAAHAIAAHRDAWMARAERRAATTSDTLHPGLALVRGVVASDDDGSPVASVAVTQMLSLPLAGRSRWRECAPRTRHARPFALVLEDGALVRVDIAAGVTLHAPLAPVTAFDHGSASEGATRALVAQVAAGHPVTVMSALVRHDALVAPTSGPSGDYRSASPGSTWTLRGFAGRPVLVSAEEPEVERLLHARRNGRLALAWCGVLLVSLGGLRAEEAWVAARSERVTARSEGCESQTAVRRGRGGGTTDTYEVTRFRLPSGAVVRDRGCWEAGRDRSVRITRDTPPELAVDQAPEMLSLGGLLWLALTLGVPGWMLLVLGGEGIPWYRARRHRSSE